jgi:hypothetical protein
MLWALYSKCGPNTIISLNQATINYENHCNSPFNSLLSSLFWFYLPTWPLKMSLRSHKGYFSQKHPLKSFHFNQNKRKSTHNDFQSLHDLPASCSPLPSLTTLSLTHSTPIIPAFSLCLQTVSHVPTSWLCTCYSLGFKYISPVMPKACFLTWGLY